MMLNPKLLKPKILYENSSGSNENITLSDNVSNYSYLEIYYKNNRDYYCSVKIDTPNNKNVYLHDGVPTTDNNGWWSYQHSKVVNITGTAITNVNYNQNTLHDNNTPTNQHTDYIYITKVLGYK